MFTVTIETSDDEFTLDVTDLRFVNKWGPARTEEIWLFTDDAPAPFTISHRNFESGNHPVAIALKRDLERVTVE